MILLTRAPAPSWSVSSCSSSVSSSFSSCLRLILFLIRPSHPQHTIALFATLADMETGAGFNIRVCLETLNTERDSSNMSE